MTTRWNSPVNIEKRDYLQVEKDAWSARERVGDIPMTVISNQYSPAETTVAEFAEADPTLVTNEILEVVQAARAAQGPG